MFSTAYLHIVAYLAYAFTTIFIRTVTLNFYMYCGAVCMFGIFDGLFLCCILPMAYETAESSKLVNQALGYSNTFISFSMFAGPTISGILFEKFNNYNLAYDIAIATSFVAALVLSFYPDFGLYKTISKIIKNFFVQKSKNAVEQSRIFL